MSGSISERAHRIFCKAMWPDDDGLVMITEELQAAHREAIEDAAKVADHFTQIGDPYCCGPHAKDIAATIRSLTQTGKADG